MIRQLSNRRRSGFTLIELLVATAIATLLMLALYSAFDITVTQTDIGRERVAHTDLARSIVNRMGGDIASTMGLLQPQSGQPYPPPSSSGGSGSGASTTPTTSTGSTVVDVTTAVPDSTGYSTLLPMELGMYGDSQTLTMFVTKVPQWQLQRTPLSDPTNTDPTIVLPTDLRRVTYYVASGGAGLCRQERLWATAAGTGDAIYLDNANESQEILAPEVTGLTFEYLDSSGWQSTWDGTTVASDGSAMLGAPRAIRVTLTFQVLDDNGQSYTKTVQHVFPVRSSIGMSSTSSTSTSTGGQTP